MYLCLLVWNTPPHSFCSCPGSSEMFPGKTIPDLFTARRYLFKGTLLGRRQREIWALSSKWALCFQRRGILTEEFKGEEEGEHRVGACFSQCFPCAVFLLCKIQEYSTENYHQTCSPLQCSCLERKTRLIFIYLFVYFVLHSCTYMCTLAFFFSALAEKSQWIKIRPFDALGYPMRRVLYWAI